MSASLFDASIYPDSWFNKHCYYGGMFDKNRVYSTKLALHGINEGNTKGKLVRAHHRDSGVFSGEAVSNSSSGEWVMPVGRYGNHVASCIDATTNQFTEVDARNSVTCAPMNGSHGDTVFLDITGNSAVINVGVTVTTAATDPFGGSSGVANFASEGTYLYFMLPYNVNPNGFNTPKNYTLRFWWYPKTINTTSYALIARTGDSSANVMALTRNATANQLGIICNGVGTVLGGTALPTLNQWTFVEINRSTALASVTNRMFFDGALHASGTNTTEFSAATNFILLGGNWTGYACDFQFLTYAKNTAAYSSPTKRLPFNMASATVTPLIEDSIQPL